MPAIVIHSYDLASPLATVSINDAAYEALKLRGVVKIRVPQAMTIAQTQAEPAITMDMLPEVTLRSIKVRDMANTEHIGMFIFVADKCNNDLIADMQHDMLPIDRYRLRRTKTGNALMSDMDYLLSKERSHG